MAIELNTGVNEATMSLRANVDTSFLYCQVSCNVIMHQFPQKQRYFKRNIVMLVVLGQKIGIV